MGYKLGGVKGAMVSMLGVILPSFVIMLGIASLFLQFDDVNPLVLSAFRGVRISVVALITYAGFRLFKASTNRYRIALSVVIFLIVFLSTINPFIVIASVVIMAMVLPEKVHQHANH
jgi:chromate transporter